MIVVGIMSYKIRILFYLAVLIKLDYAHNIVKKLVRSETSFRITTFYYLG